jgi:hypothetical protein
MTGLQSQRSMKELLRQPPVCSELRLFSREAITQVCAVLFAGAWGLSVIEIFQQLTSGPPL